VKTYIGNWIGTDKGLPLDWHKEVDVNATKGIHRPTCKECGKYRCRHIIYRGKAQGTEGVQIPVQDPRKIKKVSTFTDAELQNFSPRGDHI